MATTKNYYAALADISVKSHVEKKGGLDYLSWATAWHLLKCWLAFRVRLACSSLILHRPRLCSLIKKGIPMRFPLESNQPMTCSATSSHF